MTKLRGIVLCAALLWWFPARYPLQEIWASVAHVVLLFALVDCVVIIAVRSQRTILNALLVAIVFGLSVVRQLPPANAAPEAAIDSRRLRVLWANVERTNTQYEAFRAVVRSHNPDILLVGELTPIWAEEIRKLSEFQAESIAPDPGYFGIGIWGKSALWAAESVVHDLGDDVPKVVVVTVPAAVPEGALSIAALHALPPVSADNITVNRLLFRRLGTELRSRPGEVLVVGDFNATRASGYYRSFTDWLGLRPGCGWCFWGRTWNARYGGGQFEIDHAVASVHIANFTTTILPAWGSDHRPLLTEFTY